MGDHNDTSPAPPVEIEDGIRTDTSLDEAIRRVGEKIDARQAELRFLDDQLQILLNARNIAIVVLQQED